MPLQRIPCRSCTANMSGDLFSGCNVENSSYGLTVLRSVWQSSRWWLLVIVRLLASLSLHPLQHPQRRGACRQVISEFASPEVFILSECDGQNVQGTTWQVAPSPFAAADLRGFIGGRPVGKKQRICIDIDNVVTKTDKVIREIIAKETNGRVNLSYEHIVHFNSGSAGTQSQLTGKSGDLSTMNLPHHREYTQAQPLPGANKAVNTLPPP